MRVRDSSAGDERAPDRSPGTGPLQLLRDIVDRSIAMYVVRRLFGRRGDDRADARPIAGADLPAATALAADRPVAVATDVLPARTSRIAATFYGADAPAAPPRASTTPPSAASRDPGPARGVTRAPVERAATGPGTDRARPSRERLVRDAGVALVAIAVLGLAVVVWPRGPVGGAIGTNPGVIRAKTTSTPDTSAPAASETAATAVDASPSGDVAAETNRPTLTPPGGAAPTPTPAPTRRPTASPKATATPTLATPTATSSGSSQAPTPTPSQAPTPTPTPAPTPQPTPTPTPEPTPTPVPTPSPT